jgi:hypothetical protein
MRKILFLDFDGVLHPDGVGTFSKLSDFEQCVIEMTELEIIISSSWRETHSFEKLKNIFPDSLREKIVGITPSLQDGYESGGRQREIEAFLATAGLNSTNASWVALDDMASFFYSDCPFLILTKSEEGFGGREHKALLDWYKNSIDHR